MSANNFANIVAKLQKLHAANVPMDADVRQHVATIYNSIHGSGGESFVEREANFMREILADKSYNWDVTPLSVYLAFVDLAVRNLSLEPGAQAMCYLLVRSAAVNTTDSSNKVVTAYEKRCYLSITGYGEILLRQRAGQIRHCDAPTVVYKGDAFTYAECDGRKIVNYGLNLQHDISQPIACFMKITRIDDSVDYAVMLPEAWQRLQAYSQKQNEKSKRPANALYTSGVGESIDPGFLIAKCVKHAFKSYPKLPIGKGSIMEADIPVEEKEPDYYTMNQPAEKETEAEKPQTFEPEVKHDEGVVIEPSGDDDDMF